MSTIEKLIVRIFEQKNSIIEQVRHQLELDDQQLASKLVIQGIDPPSWLWNHEAPSHSSDPSEIDKQRLISEILLPLPQQPVQYFNNFNYNSLSIPECKFDQHDEPMTACFDSFCHVPGISTEVEPAAASPKQQVATRLDDGNSGLDLSRAEFKRSKSRQRALEQRSSAKSAAKSHWQDGNISVVSYRNGTPGMSNFLSSNNLEEPDSAKYLNIQLDDSAKHEGVSPSSRTEHKASKGYGNICISAEPACSKTEIEGAVFNEQVNEPIQSEDPLNMPRECDAVSADIGIQSSNVNNSSRSIVIQHLHHDESVDRMCKSNNFGDESSRQIKKSARLSDSLGICCEGDVESEGIDIRWSKKSNTSEEIPNQRVEHVCGCIAYVSDMKNAGTEFRGLTDKPTQFQETLNVKFGDTASKTRNTECSEEDNANEAIPSLQCNHEVYSTELDIHYASKTVGVVTGGQIDENLTEEIPSIVSHCNCSPDAAMEVHNLSTRGEVPLPSRISSSEISSGKLLGIVPTAARKDNEKGSAFSPNSIHDHPQALELMDLVSPTFIGDKNSVIMEEKAEDHSGSEEILGKFSADPVKTESSLQKSSELVPNFPAAENDGGVIGISISCSLSESHDHVLQSLQFESPTAIIASTEKESNDCFSRKNSPKSSGVKSSEVYTSSCGLEGGNSLLEELKVLKTEVQVEVPQLRSAIVEQRKLQKEDANLMACDYPLLNGVVHDQENIYRVQSVLCYGTSKDSEDSYLMQDNIGVEEDSKFKATSTLLKSTTSSFSKNGGKVEAESLRFSSHEAKQPADDSLMIEKTSGCFLKGSPISLDVQEILNKEHSESKTLSTKSALEMESSLAGFEENTFVDAEFDGLMDSDQSMPILEGFVMDTDDGESLLAGGQIDIEETSLPGSTLKRASLLERLCQSSSRNTPISQFPMTYGFHKTSELFQSVPTGLLEHISLVGDCSNMKLQQKSHSAGLPASTDFNVSRPYASPSKKKWDHSTSSSGLRSQGSLNPELVCFTIEEDQGNCDEIVNNDEAAEAPQGGVSCLKNSSKRKPLTDITEDINNPHPSESVTNKDVLEASQTPKFRFRSQLDSTGTEANLTGAQTRAWQKLGKKFSNKKRRLNDAKENRNVSAGANGGKKVTDLLKETMSQKPKYSENLKATTGVSDQLKVPRSNNIVSNMSSFIPLVQQKKAAAVVTGKRDVKVKALEAAEAAKRLAEKKENERNAKKEAWKAEKARLEQENLLQLELKKKKKEEELRKKEAEMAARKRRREEEEKKEKEGKRRRIEEARKQQHEQEKKQADKLTRHQADGLRIHEKDSNNGLEQCTKMETGGRKCRVTTENEDKYTTVPCDTKTSLHDLKGSNTLMKADIGDSNLTMVVSDFNATSEKNPKAEVLQSYDISPYRGSDDEDEDDENDNGNDNERRKKKFVPAWASKNSLAEAVFAQQHINPNEILPPESFCGIAEVLIPRKLPVR